MQAASSLGLIEPSRRSRTDRGDARMSGDEDTKHDEVFPRTNSAASVSSKSTVESVGHLHTGLLPQLPVPRHPWTEARGDVGRIEGGEYLSPGAMPTGPWTSPPGCNSTAWCEALLGVAGTSLCYHDLAPIDGDVVSWGGCACLGTWARDGPGCKATSTATAGTAVLYAVAVLLYALVLSRFMPTVYFITKERLWRINAVGTTFAFALVSLGCFVALAMINFASTLGNVQELTPARLGFGRAGVILLSMAILNLTAAFVEMSATTRSTANVNRLLRPYIAVIVAIATLVTLMYFVAPPIATTVVIIVIVFGLAIASIAGPAVLYVRSARNMARATGVGREAPTSALLGAMLRDVVCAPCAGGNPHGSYMMQVLGLHESDSEVRDFSSSRETVHTRSPPRGSPRTLSKGLDRVDSKESVFEPGHPETNTTTANTTAMIDPSQSVGLGIDVGTNTSGAPTSPSNPTRSLRAGSKESLLKGDQGSMRGKPGGATAGTSRHPSREGRMVRFLSRTLKMGVFLTCNLVLWLIIVSIAVVVNMGYDYHTTFRVSAFMSMLQAATLSAAYYCVLSYLAHQYVNQIKAIEKARRKSRPRFDSKDSKLNDESKHDSKYDTIVSSLV